MKTSNKVGINLFGVMAIELENQWSSDYQLDIIKFGFNRCICNRPECVIAFGFDTIILGFSIRTMFFK